MAPTQPEQHVRRSTSDFGRSRQMNRTLDGVAQSSSAAQRLRNEGIKFPLPSDPAMYLADSGPAESWVEISSQPSSSSLSSIGDEIVTTGLRIQQTPLIRHRRRSHNNGAAGSRIGLLSHQTSASSQEEYEESESEEDHVMTSSNEHVPSFTRIPPVVQSHHGMGSDSDDDDENATALGRVVDEPAFTPQPNAFSHPPSSQTSHRHSASTGSYFPRNSPHATYQQRHSYPNRSSSRPQHSPYNAISPHADHDAALRASLTTLLSCAAAARGLPKRSQSNLSGSPSAPSRPEFQGLRLVPESEIMGTSPAALSRPLSPSPRVGSSPSETSLREVEKGKRKAGGASVTKAPAAQQSRAAKKKRTTNGVDETMISPTLLTWVVSAGVVVLVSVVGFGAGYAIGREVGREEALAMGGAGTSCGKEMARSTGELRKFRWGGNGRGIVA
jgi:hypothetical protein